MSSPTPPSGPARTTPTTSWVRLLLFGQVFLAFLASFLLLLSPQTLKNLNVFSTGASMGSTGVLGCLLLSLATAFYVPASLDGDIQFAALAVPARIGSALAVGYGFAGPSQPWFPFLLLDGLFAVGLFVCLNWSPIQLRRPRRASSVHLYSRFTRLLVVSLAVYDLLTGFKFQAFPGKALNDLRWSQDAVGLDLWRVVGIVRASVGICYVFIPAIRDDRRRYGNIGLQRLMFGIFLLAMARFQDRLPLRSLLPNLSDGDCATFALFNPGSPLIDCLTGALCFSLARRSRQSRRTIATNQANNGINHTAT